MEIRVADNNKDTFFKLYDLLLNMHEEIGLTDVNHEHAGTYIYNVLQSNMCFIAVDGDDIVGTLGLIEGEFWYNNDVPMLYDSWFYVHKDYRNGNVGTELFKAARDFAEQTETVLIIAVTNPEKQRRKFVKTDLAGFYPAGYSIKVDHSVRRDTAVAGTSPSGKAKRPARRRKRRN